MKKLLMLMLAAVLLSACSDDNPKTEPVEETPTVEEPATEEQPDTEEKPVVEETPAIEEEPEKETASSMTAKEAKEIIDYYGLGEDDEIQNVSVQDGEIKAVVKFAENKYFGPKDLAVTSYSQTSDEMLNQDGWEVLTIEYIDAGTISMNRKQKESNEAGDYFPTAEIEGNLK